MSPVDGSIRVLEGIFGNASAERVLLDLEQYDEADATAPAWVLPLFHGPLSQACFFLRSLFGPSRSSWIVTSLDVVEDIRPRFGAGLILPSVDAFPLEQAEKVLRGGIVSAAPHGAHAAQQPTGSKIRSADRCGRAPRRIPHRRYRWAELLQRVFEVDTLQCPRCGSTLRLIAAIEAPAIARKILECMKLPARPPPLEPASGIALPPEPATPDREAGWEFDQSPVHQEPEFH